MIDPLDWKTTEELRQTAKRNAKLAEEELCGDLKWLMSSPNGRRIVYWLLEKAGIMRTTFQETPSRSANLALVMAHEEGRKQIGYELFARVNTLCPELYMKMMKEKSNGRNEQSGESSSGG